MAKAIEHVQQSCADVSDAISCLERAKSMAEKPHNKSLITDAINSLDTVCKQLNAFND